jgi:transposase
VIAHIQRLYAWERRWVEHRPDRRRDERTQHAVPIIDAILHEVDRLRPLATPRSPLGQALRYVHNLRTRVGAYRHLPIDNNALERLWKPIALGRKNYLFVGNVAGGERAASAYTLMLNCRIHKREPFDYLRRAVAGLHARQDPATLTPRAMAHADKTSQLTTVGAE